MEKRDPIINRNDKRTTPYYPAGKITLIPGIGEFPKLLQLRGEGGGEIYTTFKLTAITADFIYYGDENESDYDNSIVMLNRKMELISDNFFASNDLFGLVQENDGLLWISKSVRFWQREEFVKSRQITPGIRKILKEVDIDRLTDKERAIYFAYLNNGPVKHTKAESIMAVLSVDISQKDSSQQIVGIKKVLERKKRKSK